MDFTPKLAEINLDMMCQKMGAAFTIHAITDDSIFITFTSPRFKDLSTKQAYNIVDYHIKTYCLLLKQHYTLVYDIADEV